MANFQDKALKWLNIAGRGFILENVPKIAKGMLNYYLKGDPDTGRKPVTVRDILEIVDRNESLWKHISPQDYKRIQNIALKIGDLDWLTPGWIIDAGKGENPAIASLFVNDERCYAWLTTQVNEVKMNVEQLKSVPQI
jgi:hypothetical protein